MSQFVFEFGSERPEPVLQALYALMGPPYSADVLPSERQESLRYEPARPDLVRIEEDLRKGAIVSVVLRNQSEGIRYGLVVPPRFNGQPFSLWMGTLETTAPQWKSTWDSLLQCSDLRFVCLGSEEGIELSDDLLSPGTFPWGEWPLIIGALRTSEGDWLVKENPNRSPLRAPLKKA